MCRDEFTEFDISGVGVGSAAAAAEYVVFAGVDDVGEGVVGGGVLGRVVHGCGVVLLENDWHD
jgi:hypothetical protein